MIDCKLAAITEAYLLKLEKNLSQDFEVIDIFSKCGFKHTLISQTFLYLQENKSSFLKFDHSLLRMPKIIEIGQIFPAEKRDFKT